MDNIRVEQLSNGLKIVFVNIPSSKAFTATAYVRAGCRFDPLDKPGLAHFSEHMFFNGCKKYPSRDDLAKVVDQNGGWHHAFTWIDFQKHTVQTPLLKAKEGLDVLLCTLFTPILRETDIQNEKGTVLEEMSTNKADPNRAMWDYVANPLFFQGTRLERSYSGSEKDVTAITLDDVRGFMDSYVNPRNTTLFVAGSLDKRISKQLINLSGNVKGENSKIEHIKIEPKIKRKELEIKDSNYYHSSVIVGAHVGEVTSDDRYALDIIRNIVGNFYSSPILRELREQGGLVYGWQSFIDYYQGGGIFLFNVSCKKANVKRVKSIVVKGLEALGEGKIDKVNFEIAKGFTVGSLQTSLERGSDYIEWYGLQEVEEVKEFVTVDNATQKYKEITIDNVIGVARKYFNPSNILAGTIG